MVSAAQGTPLAPAAANTLKRDFLQTIERRSQLKWENDKLFQTDSPYTQQTNPTKVPTADFAAEAETLRKNGQDKWFGTFPYPVSSSCSASAQRESSELIWVDAST